MKYQQPSMEGTLFAMRDTEGGRGMVRNILIGQAANQVGNMLLDAFEPSQRKREEDRDAGDRFRDFARGALNIATGANYAYQMAKGYGLLDSTPKGAAKGETQDLGSQPPSSPPARPGAAENAPSQTVGFAPYGLLKGSEPTMTERTRQGEDLVRAARAERMPGVMVGDLSQMVDQDMMNRLRGLESEAAAYPKPDDGPTEYEKGIAAGMEAMAMQNLAQQKAQKAAPRQETSTYRAPTKTTNPLVGREPASSFAEQFGDTPGRRETSAEREARTNESLANFYANIPADPETGERKMNFATNFLVDRGAVAPETVVVVDAEVDQPRNSGGLLRGQLSGETLYNQQENRGAFVQDQHMDAIYSGDEQGPGFTSGSIADMFQQQAQALAQSDARLYRSLGERIGNMKQILREAEGVPQQKQTQMLQNTSGQGGAQEQVNNFMAQMLDANAAAQAGIQKQVAARETPRFAPTPEMVPNYVMPERRAVSEKPSVAERLKSAGIAMRGMPFEHDGDGIGMEVQARGDMPGRTFDTLSDIGAKASLERAGVSAQEASDYWTGKLKSEGIIGAAEPTSSSVPPSMTVASEPAVKKTTIIEETVPASQQRMSPLEASEKLRRIQNSGRPNARQEAQDFLASIKGQMING
jgi:hypothetical protein